MISLTHITARYLKALGDGKSNYAGRWALIRFKGDQLEFAAFDRALDDARAYNWESSTRHYFIS